MHLVERVFRLPFEFSRLYVPWRVDAWIDLDPPERGETVWGSNCFYDPNRLPETDIHTNLWWGAARAEGPVAAGIDVLLASRKYFSPPDRKREDATPAHVSKWVEKLALARGV